MKHWHFYIRVGEGALKVVTFLHSTTPNNFTFKEVPMYVKILSNTYNLFKSYLYMQYMLFIYKNVHMPAYKKGLEQWINEFTYKVIISLPFEELKMKY